MAIFMNDPAEVVKRAYGIREGQGAGVNPLDPKPLVSGMAEALARSQAFAERLGLKNTESISNAQRWLRESGLARLEHDRDLLYALGQLLDRVGG